MTDSTKGNLRSIWGLRHYRKGALPEIIFNRLIHRLGYHYCVCNRFIKLDECMGVINNDCMMCMECVE